MSDNGKMSENKHVTFEGNKTTQSDMITIEIDLTNPEDLIQKLELIDLTEKENDQLLEQALHLNEKLKKELHRRSANAANRSFHVSAPASGTANRSNTVGGTSLTASFPRLTYRDDHSKSASGLARLHSGYMNLRQPPELGEIGPCHNAANFTRVSPYSYHSARPIRSIGSYGSSRPSEGAGESERN